MRGKERIDKILVDRGLVQSRQRAKGLIMAGMVFVNGKKVDKAGTLVGETAEVYLKEKDISYVSRGGLKLETALEKFKIDVTNRICLDVGASTGGFTDCLFRYGARMVYAVDVGYGQLDWKLRNDSRVVNIEKINIRYFTRDKLCQILKDRFKEGTLRTCDFNFVLSEQSFEKGGVIERILPGLATIDVSFISVKKVLPPVYQLLKEKAKVIALIKPQFEADRKKVKRGVVRDRDVICEVVEGIKHFSKNLDFRVKGIIPSPLKGPAGNEEYLIYLEK